MIYDKRSTAEKVNLVRECLSKKENVAMFCREKHINYNTFLAWIKRYGECTDLVIRQNENQRILVISDLHIPYHHPDAFAFLRALHNKYNFTRIVNIGDEVDNHAMSFHDSDPDLPSAGNELHQARICLQELQRIFPHMDIIKSNHGDMFERKLRAHGIPSDVLVDRITMYRVEPTWKIHSELVLEMPNGDEVLFHHGLGANVLNASKERGMSLVQGHFHSEMDLRYWRSNKTLAFGMVVGCLIDRDKLAFLYARENKRMQLIGCGGIIDSYPRLFPMRLDKGGRWNGELP